MKCNELRRKSERAIRTPNTCYATWQTGSDMDQARWVSESASDVVIARSVIGERV